MGIVSSPTLKSKSTSALANRQVDICDRDHLEHCGPASTWNTAIRRVGLTEGFDETHEVSGDGSAELPNDGSIKIEFAYHDGDEAV
jgi:hypothetical protein